MTVSGAPEKGFDTLVQPVTRVHRKLNTVEETPTTTEFHVTMIPPSWVGMADGYWADVDRNVGEVRSRRSAFGDDPHRQRGGEDRRGPSVRRDRGGRLGRRAPSARLSGIAVRVDDRDTSAGVHVDGQVFSERVFEDILTPRHRETVLPDRRVGRDGDDGGRGVRRRGGNQKDNQKGRHGQLDEPPETAAHVSHLRPKKALGRYLGGRSTRRALASGSTHVNTTS